jgi:hypothetical protein
VNYAGRHRGTNGSARYATRISRFFLLLERMVPANPHRSGASNVAPKPASGSPALAAAAGARTAGAHGPHRAR